MAFVNEYRNVTDKHTDLYLIAELLGYEIYMPRFFYNPLRCFEPGCYLWINVGKNTYDKYEIDNADTWLCDIASTIRNTLERRSGLAVRKVTASDLGALSQLTACDISDINLQESALVEDWDCSIQGFALVRDADINEAVGQDKYPIGLPSYSIVCYQANTEASSSLLRAFMAGRYDHRLMQGDGALLWYKINDEEKAQKDSIKKELGLLAEDGDVIITQRS